MSQTHIILCAEIRITDENKTIDFMEGATARTATLSTGIYFLYGDGSETGAASSGTSSGDLSANIIAAMNAAAASTTYTAEVYFWPTIDRDCSLFTLYASSGNVQLLDTSTFDISWLGFTSPSASSTFIDSDSSSPFVWLPDQPYFEVRRIKRNSEYSQHFTPSGKVNSFKKKDEKLELSVPFRLVAPERSIYTDTQTNITNTFEAFWDKIRGGQYLRMYLPTTTSGVFFNMTESVLYVQGVVLLESTSAFEPSKVDDMTQLYEWDIVIKEVSEL